MRDDDVPHIISGEAKPFDLVSDGFLVAQNRPDNVTSRSHARRIGAVQRAEATVHQDQAVVGLDQQHVADHRSGRQVHGAAVEMMDLHDWPAIPSLDASICSTSWRAASRST